jgi:hypothetical protein
MQDRVLIAPILISSSVHGGIGWGYHYGRDEDVRNLEGIGGDGSFSAPRGSTLDLQIADCIHGPVTPHDLLLTIYRFYRDSVVVQNLDSMNLPGVLIFIIMQYHVYIPQRQPKRYAPAHRK